MNYKSLASLYKKHTILVFYLYKYTVAVFRHPKRGAHISFQMVVSHHVVV